MSHCGEVEQSRVEENELDIRMIYSHRWGSASNEWLKEGCTPEGDDVEIADIRPGGSSAGPSL